MHKEKAYSLLEDDKETIKESLTKTLNSHAEISFAYLHGSFIKANGFRDIDLAVYLEELPSSVLEYELRLEAELIGVLRRYQVDVRVLNRAHLSFRYNVIKDGIPLIVRNDDERIRFQETTIDSYFDFAHYRHMYLKETLGTGV